MIRTFARGYETWFDGVAQKLFDSIGISRMISEIPGFVAATTPVTITVLPDGSTTARLCIEDNRPEEQW